MLSTLGCLPEDESVFTQEFKAEVVELTFSGTITVHAAKVVKLHYLASDGDR